MRSLTAVLLGSRRGIIDQSSLGKIHHAPEYCLTPFLPVVYYGAAGGGGTAGPRLSPTGIAAKSFDTDLATLLAKMRCVAYNTREEIEAWSCPFCTRAGPADFQVGTTNGSVFELKRLDLQFYVGYYPALDANMLVFRYAFPSPLLTLCVLL